MKKIILLEVRRQVLHLCFGAILAFLLYINIIDGWFLTAALLCMLALILHWKSHHGKNSFFKKVLSFFEREEHIERFPGRGVFFFLLGTLFTVILFPQKIAIASIIILAVGDSVSHLYGRFLGKIKIPFFPEKNAEGHIIAACLAGVISSSLIPFPAALLAAFIAMLFEIPRWHIGTFPIDDNVIIPLVAGLTLLIYEHFFPFLQLAPW